MELFTGRPFDLEAYREVPHLLYLGDQDENDSVPYDDGYDDEDEGLVMALFGPTPVARWEIAREIYESIDADAQFLLYPGVGHKTTPEIEEEIETFVRDVLAGFTFAYV